MHRHALFSPLFVSILGHILKYHYMKSETTMAIYRPYTTNHAEKTPPSSSHVFHLLMREVATCLGVPIIKNSDETCDENGRVTMAEKPVFANFRALIRARLGRVRALQCSWSFAVAHLGNS